MIASDVLKSRLMEGDLLQMQELKQQVLLLTQQEEQAAKAHFDAVYLLDNFIKEHGIVLQDVTSSFVSTPHVNMMVENDTAHGFVVYKQGFETLEEFQKLQLTMHQNLIKLHEYAATMNKNRLRLLDYMISKLNGTDMTKIQYQLAPIKAQIYKLK